MVSDGADWARHDERVGDPHVASPAGSLFVRRGILLKLLAGNLSGQGSSPSTSG